LHPGQRNSLDALCKRYSVDNSARELHGALLDARILADVYLAMTGGQSALALTEHGAPARGMEGARAARVPVRSAVPLVVLRATPEELAGHEAMLAVIASASGGRALWAVLEPRVSADALSDPVALHSVGALAPLAEAQRPSA
jgi:DNA polymerase-3 subunit epsilon